MKSSIQFWLSQEGKKDRLQLPVNPDKVGLKTGVNHIDTEVVGLGEITTFGKRKLHEIELSSFLPKTYNPSYCEYTNVPKPYDTIKKLLKWSVGNIPLRLTITGTNINMLVTIRDLQYEEKAGEVGDIYFTLSLKEYRSVTIRQVKKKQKSNSGSGSTKHPHAKWKWYTITKGDTLIEIAEAYKNCSLQDIYDLNPGIKAKALKVGQKIKIPYDAVKIRAVQKVSNRPPSPKKPKVTTKNTVTNSKHDKETWQQKYVKYKKQTGKDPLFPLKPEIAKKMKESPIDYALEERFGKNYYKPPKPKSPPSYFDQNRSPYKFPYNTSTNKKKKKK